MHMTLGSKIVTRIFFLNIFFVGDPNKFTFATIRTSLPKLCPESHPTQGSDCKICRSGRYNLCPKMRFIGSAVNRVPGALCQKFNHKVWTLKTVV